MAVLSVEDVSLNDLKGASAKHRATSAYTAFKLNWHSKAITYYNRMQPKFKRGVTQRLRGVSLTRFCNYDVLLVVFASCSTSFGRRRSFMNHNEHYNYSGAAAIENYPSYSHDSTNYPLSPNLPRRNGSKSCRTNSSWANAYFRCQRITVALILLILTIAPFGIFQTGKFAF